MAAMLLLVSTRGTTTASASLTHPLLSTTSACGAPISPGGAAVDSAAGQLYVLSNVTEGKIEDVVSAYSLGGSTSTCLWENDGSEVPQHAFAAISGEGNDIAVAPASGDVLVANTVFGVVNVLNKEGAYLFTFNGAETPRGKLTPFGVSVGPEGDVYVSDAEGAAVDRFDAAGKYLSQIRVAEQGGRPRSVSVGPLGEVYVVMEHEDSAHRVTHFVGEYASNGTFLRSECAKAPVGIAVSSAGDLYCAYPARIEEFNAAGALVARFGPPNVGAIGAIAVGGSGSEERVYAADGGAGLLAARVEVFGAPAEAPTVSTGEATDIHKTSAVLHGQIDPESSSLPASYRFEYEVAGGSVQLESPETVVGVGTANVEVSAEITGLAPNTEYRYRLLGFGEHANGTNGQVEGEEASFVTAGPPAVGEERAVEVGSGEATLEASVTPNGADTDYYLEYGTSSSYGSGPIPAAGVAVGAGRTGIAMRQVINGLSAETLYHFRVVAQSAEGVTDGPDETFQTFASSGGLPDGRAYELVSRLATGEEVDAYSPAKIFQEANAGHVSPVEAATGGEAMAYMGDPSAEGNGLSNEYLAQRGSSGWVAHDISPPTQGPDAECPEPNLVYSPYLAFSGDLSQGIVSMVATPALVAGTGAPACYLNLFVRQTSFATSDVSSYRPLITSKPSATKPYEFGFAPLEGLQPFIFELVGGETDNLSDILFASNFSVPVTEGPSAVSGGVDENNLYEAVGTNLRVVNVLPGQSKSAPGASFGASSQVSGEEQTPPNATRAVSSDGSRVFWTDTAASPTKLFVRENGETSVQLDKPQGVSGAGGGGHYWIASTNGSVAFFTDGAALTKEVIAGSGTNLYKYEVETGHLVDLTGGLAEVGVQGVVGASEDGSYVYFVATGDLVDGETATNGEVPILGDDNLYTYHAGAAKPLVFLGRLSPRDDEIAPDGQTSKIGLGDWRGSVAQETARVTGDGQFMVLMSREQLTSYGNDGHDEVYLYDAETDSFACVSCDASGAAPTGEAALVPDTSDGYQPRWVSEDGSRVFFDSDEALAAGDTNRTWDVYEYEGGRDYLISSGTSPEGSYFDDATPSGDDVFFTTRAKLTPEDQGDVTNIWDARVGGGFPQASSVAVCGSEAACRPAASGAPVLGGSETGSVGLSGNVISANAPVVPVVSVVGSRRSGAFVVLRVKTTGKGRLKVSCSGCKVWQGTVADGTRSVSVRLLKRTVEELRHARTGRAMAFTVRFTGTAGHVTVVHKTIVVGA